ncbi:hypothetical protein ABBQ38_000322 [Trebouxia sp. C0009 RCD-2024]
MATQTAPTLSVQTRDRWWSGIPNLGWTVVGLAFVAGASGAAFNHFYTGDLDKETRQKYTAITTFGGVLVVRAAHTLWTSWRSDRAGGSGLKKSPAAADTRGDEGSAAVARRRRPRRDT